MLEVAPFNTDGNAVPLLTNSLGFCPKPSLFHLHFLREFGWENNFRLAAFLAHYFKDGHFIVFLFS